MRRRGLYHGNIFQDAPTFPSAEKKAQVGTWGVETEFRNVFLCGSSARRGVQPMQAKGRNFNVIKLLGRAASETRILGNNFHFACS